MKRVFLLFLVLMLVLALPACGRRSPAPAEPVPTPAPAAPADEPETEPAGEPSASAEAPSEDPAPAEAAPDPIPEQDTENASESAPSETEPEGSDEPEASVPIPDEDGWYYDVENVTAYLMAYGHLPSNFITKRDAEDLGWSGGSVERFREGAAIGGGRFGNYEGLLPEGRYTECDIDTDGASSRGAKRLVFSTDGRYFYTDDHYETFAEVTFVDGRMVLNYDY